MVESNYATEGLFLLVILVGGATDLLYRKVYNHLTMPALVLGAGMNLWFFGGHGLWSSLLGLLVGFVPLFLVFLVGGMGGGDVKLMAAVGAIMGYPFIMAALLYSALAGGVLGLGLVVWKRQWRSLGADLSRALNRMWHPFSRPADEPDIKHAAAVTLPYGFAIFLGCLWAWLEMRFFHVQ